MKYLPKNVKDRTRGIGGSDIGALFGLNPRCSLPRLWLEKTGKVFDHDDTEPMEWGVAFEDTIATRFAKKTKRRLIKVNRTIVHPRYTFMLANPDRLQYRGASRGVLEIKATIFGNLKAWATGGIPAPYYLQLQHYLEVCGCQWGSFAVLFGGNKLIEFDVQRDDKLISLMIEREQQFWDLVQKRQPPPIALSADWNKHLAAFFPSVRKGEQKELLTPEAIGRARRYLNLKAQIDKREQELDEHEVFFKQQIGEAERLLIKGVAKINWTAFERSHVDLDKLRKDEPIIAERYTSKHPQRRFLLTGLEDNLIDDDTEQDDATPVLYGARRIELD